MNLILIFILLQFLTRSYKTSYLSCGLFGACGNDKHKPDPLIVKLLGVYSIKRGDKGSGIFIDKEIRKSVLSFADFSTQFQIINTMPWQTNTIIGHARAPTYGANKEDNSHPFAYGEKDDIEFVFSHNGTIIEPVALGKEYNMDFYKEFDVDSDMLGAIMYNHGYEEVLTKYKGAAAFAATKPKEPNTLLLFSGASKEYAHGAVLEERPLHYAIHPKTGVMYYASEADFLKGALNTKVDIVKVPHNEVLHIHNGKIVKQVPIDRSKIINREVTYSNNWPNNKSNKHSNAFEDTTPKKLATRKHQTLFDTKVNEKDQRLNIKDRVIWFEGFCYYNDKLASGKLCLSITGKITDEGKEYHFYQGVHVKDKASFDKLCILGLDAHKRTNLYKIQDYMHKDTLLKQTYYWTDSSAADGDITPMFSRNKLTFADGGVLQKCVDKFETETNLLKSPPQITLLHTMIGNNTVTNDAWSEEYDKEYAAWRKEWAGEDAQLDAFNEFYTQDFETRAEATTWHMQQYEGELHDFWDCVIENWEAIDNHIGNVIKNSTK